MMNRIAAVAVVASLLSGCAKPSSQQQAETKATIPEAKPAAPSPTHVPASPKPTPPPLAATVDPKSSAAAEELVRGFAGLINQGKFNDAYMLLGPNAPPRADFDSHFADLQRVNTTTGTAGDQEGAAGSIYVSVPITITGDANGKHVERSGSAVLRRVNDVPGSTEAQRHWHIERIDWN